MKTPMTRCVALTMIVFFSTIAPSSSASAQEQAIPVMVQTVPPLTDVGVAVDGKQDRTGTTGLAVVTVGQPGTYNVSLDASQPDPDTRASFVRWDDGIEQPARDVEVESFTFLQAGFLIDRRVSFRFSDDAGMVLSGGIDSFTIVDSIGRQKTLSGVSSQWLPTNHLTSTPGEVESERLTYSITDVVVDGNRVQTTAGGTFDPRTGLWAIDVELNPEAAAVGEPQGPESAQDPQSGEEALPFMNFVGVAVAVLLLFVAAGFILRRRMMQRSPGPAGSPEPASRPGPASSLEPARARLADLGRRVRRESLEPARARLADLGRRARRESHKITGHIRTASARMNTGLGKFVGGIAPAASALRSRFDRKPHRATKELVRVRLTSGRTIEGWTDPQMDSGQDALKLAHIVQVLNRAGQSVATKPSDAFVPHSLIASLEVLMTTTGEPVMNQSADEDLKVEADSEAKIIDLRDETRTSAD